MNGDKDVDDGFHSGNPTPRDLPPKPDSPVRSPILVPPSAFTSTPLRAGSSTASVAEYFSPVNSCDDEVDHDVDDSMRQDTKKTLETISHVIRVSKAHNELKRETKQLRTELFETSMQLEEAKALENQLELRDEKIAELERALEEKQAIIENMEKATQKVSGDPKNRIEVTAECDIRKGHRLVHSMGTQADLDGNAASKEEISQLKLEIQTVSKDKESLIKERDAAFDALQKSHVAQKTATTMVERLNKENEQLVAKVDSLSGVVTSLQDERDDISAQLRSLQQKLRSAESENEMLETQLSTVSAQLEDQTEQLTQLNKLKTGFEGREKELNDQLGALEGEKEQWASEKAVVEKQIEEQRSRLAELVLKEATIRDLDAELKKAVELGEARQEELTEALKKIKKLTEQEDSLVSSMMDAERKAEEQRLRAESLEKETIEMKKRAEELERQLGRYEEGESAIDDLRRQRTLLEEEVARLREEAQQNIQRNEFLSQKLENAPSVEFVEKLTRELSEAQSEVTRLTEKHERIANKENEHLASIRRIAELEGLLKVTEDEAKRRETQFESVVKEHLELQQIAAAASHQASQTAAAYENYKMNAEVQFRCEMEERDHQISVLRSRLSELENYPGRDVPLSIDLPAHTTTFGIQRTLGDILPQRLREALEQLREQSEEMAALVTELEKTRVDCSVGPSTPLTSIEHRSSSAESRNRDDRDTEVAPTSSPFDDGSLLFHEDTLLKLQHNMNKSNDELRGAFVESLLKLLQSVRQAAHLQAVKHAVSMFITEASSLLTRIAQFHEEKVRELGDQLVEKEQMLQDAKGDVVLVQSERDRLKDEIMEMERKYERIIRDGDSESEKNSRTIANLQEEVRDLAEHVRTLESERREMESELKKRTASIKEFKEMAQELRDDVEDSEKNVQQLHERIQGANRMVEQSERRVLEIEHELHGVQLREAEATREKAELETMVDKLRAETQKMRGEVAQLSIDLSDKSRDLSNQQKECDGLKETMRKLEKERDYANRSKLANQKSVLIAEKSFGDITVYLARMRTRHDKYRDIFMELCDRLADLVKKVNDMDNLDLKELKEEITALRTYLIETVDELEEQDNQDHKTEKEVVSIMCEKRDRVLSEVQNMSMNTFSLLQ